MDQIFKADLTVPPELDYNEVPHGLEYVLDLCLISLDSNCMSVELSCPSGTFTLMLDTTVEVCQQGLKIRDQNGCLIGSAGWFVKPSESESGDSSYLAFTSESGMDVPHWVSLRLQLDFTKVDFFQRRLDANHTTTLTPRLDILAVRQDFCTLDLTEKTMTRVEIFLWIADLPLDVNSIFVFIGSGDPGFAAITAAGTLSSIAVSLFMLHREERGLLAFGVCIRSAIFEGVIPNFLRNVKSTEIFEIMTTLAIIPYGIAVGNHEWEVSTALMFGSFLSARRSPGPTLDTSARLRVFSKHMPGINMLKANAICDSSISVLAILLTPINGVFHDDRFRRWSALAFTVVVYLVLQVLGIIVVRKFSWWIHGERFKLMTSPILANLSMKRSFATPTTAILGMLWRMALQVGTFTAIWTLVPDAPHYFEELLLPNPFKPTPRVAMTWLVMVLNIIFYILAILQIILAQCTSMFPALRYGSDKWPIFCAD